MDNNTADILGFMGESDEAAAAPVMPSLNLNLSLSDEDLEGPTESVYKPIPVGTRTDFEIYQVEQKPWTNKHGLATVQWRMVLRAEEDTWGSGKQIRHTLRFQPSESFNWGPFLKAIGLVQGAGDVDMKIFDKPEKVEGLKVSAKVKGYRWQDAQGNYQQSSGPKEKRKPVPQDGTPYFEELGFFEPAAPKSSNSDEIETDGAVFSTDEYL